MSIEEEIKALANNWEREDRAGGDAVTTIDIDLTIIAAYVRTKLRELGEEIVTKGDLSGTVLRRELIGMMQEDIRTGRPSMFDYADALKHWHKREVVSLVNSAVARMTGEEEHA